MSRNEHIGKKSHIYIQYPRRTGESTANIHTILALAPCRFFTPWNHFLFLFISEWRSFFTDECQYRARVFTEQITSLKDPIHYHVIFFGVKLKQCNKVRTNPVVRNDTLYVTGCYDKNKFIVFFAVAATPFDRPTARSINSGCQPRIWVCFLFRRHCPLKSV
jgi:hypothetical protein